MIAVVNVGLFKFHHYLRSYQVSQKTMIFITLYHDFAAFPLIYAVQYFPQDPVEGGAYNCLEYLMNKLKVVVLLVMIQEIYCTNTREYTNIPSYRGNSSSTRPAYKREYLYIHSQNCTIKLTKTRTDIK